MKTVFFVLTLILISLYVLTKFNEIDYVSDCSRNDLETSVFSKLFFGSVPPDPPRCASSFGTHIIQKYRSTFFSAETLIWEPPHVLGYPHTIRTVASMHMHLGLLAMLGSEMIVIPKVEMDTNTTRYQCCNIDIYHCWDAHIPE